MVFSWCCSWLRTQNWTCEKLALGFLSFGHRDERKNITALTHLQNTRLASCFSAYFFTAHYLPPLTTLSLGSVSGTDKARQKAFIPCDATFTGDMNKQLLMNRLLTFPQTAASTASPPSSTLHIPAPSHQSSTPLFPFHILFLTLRHASCVTQMGT